MKDERPLEEARKALRDRDNPPEPPTLYRAPATERSRGIFYAGILIALALLLAALSLPPFSIWGAIWQQ